MCLEGSPIAVVGSFMYLGSNLYTQNSMKEEYKARLITASKYFYASKQMLSSKLLDSSLHSIGYLFHGLWLKSVGPVLLLKNVEEKIWILH